MPEVTLPQKIWEIISKAQESGFLEFNEKDLKVN